MRYSLKYVILPETGGESIFHHVLYVFYRGFVKCLIQENDGNDGLPALRTDKEDKSDFFRRMGFDVFIITQSSCKMEGNRVQYEKIILSVEETG